MSCYGQDHTIRIWDWVTKKMVENSETKGNKGTAPQVGLQIYIYNADIYNAIRSNRWIAALQFTSNCVAAHL